LYESVFTLSTTENTEKKSSVLSWLSFLPFDLKWIHQICVNLCLKNNLKLIQYLLDVLQKIIRKSFQYNNIYIL
jgi:hypothetical protein